MRWDSVHKMIATILEQEEAIRRVLRSDRKTASSSLTWQDKDVLESMNKVQTLIFDRYSLRR